MHARLKGRYCACCLAQQQSSTIRAPRSSTRLFTTTRQTLAPPRTNPLSLLPPDAPPPPPYPYAAARWYKQSNRGLYGGRVIQFGNNVSDETETKTPRRWHPNIVAKNLYSRALDKTVRVMVSTRVLRTMDKVGGLDEYLIGNKPARVKELGVHGWKLRWAVLNAPGFKRRLEKDKKVVKLLGQPRTAAAPKSDDFKSGQRMNVPMEETEEIDIETANRILGYERFPHMEEAPPPPPPESMWQRISRTVMKPFRRS